MQGEEQRVKQLQRNKSSHAIFVFKADSTADDVSQVEETREGSAGPQTVEMAEQEQPC